MAEKGGNFTSRHVEINVRGRSIYGDSSCCFRMRIHCSHGEAITLPPELSDIVRERLNLFEIVERGGLGPVRIFLDVGADSHVYQASVSIKVVIGSMPASWGPRPARDERTPHR
jgi:hypothetical protein